MIIDFHIHVGQFFDEYYSPSHISQLMADVGVDYYAVSSTSICEENYERVLDEIHALIELDGEKILPVMWITPEGLKGNIAWFLESDIKWKMLKVHPELHPDAWNPVGENFHEVIEIAREMNLPILIHTGEKNYCEAGNYERLVRENDDITFVLAHGRPIYQTIQLLKYKNVYVDSAFMPVYYMKLVIDNGFASKLLWGTDMCIPKHFFIKENMREYYNKKLQEFKMCCSQVEYDLVVFRNAYNLFGFHTCSGESV